MNKPPKVLIVDDEPAILKAMQINLLQRGCEVLLATDGEEAVQMALKEKPDLILMDVVLPTIDGMEACHRIKSQSTGFIPVILVTVQNELKNKIAGMNHGADDYLTKPFVFEELNTRVAAMLRIKRAYDDQQTASITDALTGIYNRRYLQPRLKEECDRSLRYGQPFACLMLDLDHFKNINDKYGHPFGDEVLKQFAARLREHIRRADIFVRYGGEEFVLILPETDINEAKRVAENLRDVVQSKKFVAGAQSAAVTCSTGICIFPSAAATTFDSLLKRVDEALYEAKKSGRNCVRIAA